MSVQGLEDDYKEMASFRRSDMEYQHNPQSTIRTPKTIIKYYSEFYLLFYKPFRPSYIYVTRQHMSGKCLTQSKFPLEKTVELFGNLLFQLAEEHWIHTYQVVFRFCQLKGIDYLVLRYLNTGALPFEEWAEEWLHDGDV
jgi:hypothetical protein